MADILSKGELDALLSEMQGDPEEEGKSDASNVDSAGEEAGASADSGGLDLSAQSSEPISRENLDMILNIPVKVQVEIGRARLAVGEILNLCHHPMTRSRV